MHTVTGPVSAFPAVLPSMAFLCPAPTPRGTVCDYNPRPQQRCALHLATPPSRLVCPHGRSSSSSDSSSNSKAHRSQSTKVTSPSPPLAPARPSVRRTQTSWSGLAGPYPTSSAKAAPLPPNLPSLPVRSRTNPALQPAG
ncbi:hypothetical protein K461DRAFT_274896 [Myriangium duriaei CBS 260.36]|uniref:Uncharacterized protein n=1 Tax=Myriangium duriaei CBS 260.36 TaxID=1168546 RepID=A0A9P4MK06_9PEZI|nr:hypothetical protein K461DRAFT_274896 [Myriangium duriaei CBS 260.36]